MKSKVGPTFFDVRFDGESDSDSPGAQKYNLDPLYAYMAVKEMSVHVTLLDCEVSLQCSRETF